MVIGRRSTVQHRATPTGTQAPLVDPLLGQVIEAWQAVRPTQPKTIDRKTGEHVDMVFAVRAHPARNYINRTIIPALCRKAGVADTDVRGRITSHRARSTIATQLYNAKEPMTLFELQHMLTSIPLTDDEHAAVEDGQAALDTLISRLSDVPTPGGPTTSQLGLPPTATLLPIIDVKRQHPTHPSTNADST